ncbi:hypothetical protein FB192DRAFT_1467897 [Mucor lusitanicus]|uniref:HNH nuclease domain-containing protein n=1 Tax=Mucor circinelloides f. lusitanicus TaxID=29924 RepID=A0A8H4BP11_MUCCL|nr:hypothetical protein FB192DRAFT_1467897 [Mucor lusitanicus]
MDNDNDFQPPLTQAQIDQFFGRRTRRREDDAQEENQREVPIHQNYSPRALPGEQWRQLPFPLQNFSVSSLGRVKGRRRVLTQQTLRRSTDHRFYVDVQLPNNRQQWVDHLVLLGFNNDANQVAALPFVIHLDDNETNNRLENLRRGTYDQYHEVDDHFRDAHGLQRRRIVRSCRFEDYNPLSFPQRQDYIPRRYVYANGQISNVYDEETTLSPRANLAGVWKIDIRIHNREMSPPISELVVDTWMGFDNLRPLVIYLDGNLNNLHRDNLIPANHNEYATHMSLSLRAHPDEIFRPIRHMGNVDFTHYLVSNYGRVYGINSRTILSIYDGPGAYAHIILYRNGISYDFSAHRIVFSTFNDRPIGQGLVIDHVDSDRQNNRIGNLEEVTRQENTRRSVEQRRLWRESLPTSELRELQAEQQAAIPGEIWQPARIVSGDSRYPLPATGYEVSDQGRVRNSRSGLLLRNQFSPQGYYRVYLNGQGFFVHRLVASTFIANDDPHNRIYVDHINSDRTRNVVGNLRWANPRENVRFANAIRMRAFRQDREIEHIFQAISDSRGFAFNDTTFPLTTIRHHMATGIPLQGWYFVREAAPGAEGRQEFQTQIDDGEAPEVELGDEVVQEEDVDFDPLENINLE